MNTKKRIKGKNNIKKFTNEIMNRQIKALFLMTFAVFIFAGIQFTAQTGFIGLFLNSVFRTVLGEAALALPFMLGVIALSCLWPLEIENLQYRFTGLIILFCLLLITLHLMRSELFLLVGGDIYRFMFTLGWQHQGGGLLGAVLTIILFFLFRDIGSYIVISALGILAFLLITNSFLVEISAGILSYTKTVLQYFSHFSQNLSGKIPRGKNKGTSAESYTIKEYNNFEANISEEEREEEKTVKDVYHNKEMLNILTPEEDFKKSVNLTAHSMEDDSRPLSHFIQESRPLEDYHIPPVDILTRVNKLRDYQQQKGIQERARILESTFESFGVNVKIKEVQTGPAVTRFEIQPDTGVKVSKILSLSDDLALNLAAPDVRIEAPIPGKAAIGIEVPNKIISLVYLREVLEDPYFQTSPSPLTIGLGKDIAGTPVFADLLKMPHLLIAGSTGSGKSVCINTIISSILLKAAPWVVKFLLIDPKLVELSIYNGIPHLISPVIIESKKAAMALRSMVKEMERRYDLFAQQGVRDINRYNECFKSNNNHDDTIENPLPYIVVVIDELADLMMVAPSEVEDSIVRLSQMSRAAGIHLVVATQRPSVDIITGLIKANITSRIAFAVSSQIDSRTILDMGGAEKLLGRGDMLYYPIGVHKPLRVQGAFVSERDIFKLVEYIKQQESPLYQQSFFTEEAGEEYLEEEKSDPLLPEAVDLIIQTGHASISLIQRRFRVGYTRAARLIDDLERLGIVGKYEGSKPRKVLMTMDQASASLRDKMKKNEA
ncbi:MAG: DNA translocase FtsK [Dethiobacter sp.]|jgi:S-DNA-T family DNA segregation ATPase FtsK/SpoIIIE|nr:MAG: DNA translocase FtsK [Dethiobacter sp.]